MAFQHVPIMVMGGAGVGVMPPHIQLQQAQEAFILQQQQQQQLDLELEPENRQVVVEEANNINLANVLVENQNENVGGIPENAGFQLDPAAGDANNNDQPEDANNNTTDPALQQLQQQQLILQQQQQQNLQNAASDNTSDSVIENGKNDKDKKDKRKKKKKKKKNRMVTVIGADGSFRKELPASDAVNGTKKGDTSGVDGDENDEPEENVEVEYVNF